MLITEHYRNLNAQKHKESEKYGSYGGHIVTQVRELARRFSATTILDYGCGKRSLEKALGFAISNYDPAIPGCEAVPEPADLVVCMDVLEHVEPECLDAVLDDLARVTRIAGLLVVDCIPAKKHLPDGRNAHLIVERPQWWLTKLLTRFDLQQFNSTDDNFMAVVRAKQKPQ